VRWYRVPGWPAGLAGHAAVTPFPHRLAGAGAVTYKDGVTGRPGTQAIPVDPVIPSPDVGDLATAGTSRSGDAPDAIWPNQYWARPQAEFWPGAGMPVSINSDNLMPVPATDPRAVPAPLAVPLDSRRVQGFTGGAINQPASLIVWPSLGNSR
jgi:hypothetical protein